MLKFLAVAVISGHGFVMCDGGPVPDGCCEPGDRLDVVVGYDGQACADMGGTLNGVVCVDWDGGNSHDNQERILRTIGVLPEKEY